MTRRQNRGEESSKAPPLRLFSKLVRLLKRRMSLAIVVAIAVIAGHSLSAQISLQPLPPANAGLPLASLKTVPVPEPANLGKYVSNKTNAIALGKALFWDMQVGSDAKQSCASCHFHAGADNRSKNQISPGLLIRPNPDKTFQVGGGANYQLAIADFPFHKLSDPNNRNSVVSDKNDIASSQGVFNSTFNSISTDPNNPVDNVTFTPDQDGFQVAGKNVRRVEPRNTPTVINAVFNFRNFWDGRAQNEFNGRNPFGQRDVDAFVVRAVTPTQLEKVNITQDSNLRLNNSSLASQAVGPPLSQFEMSAAGRTFPDLGAKFAFLSMKLGRKTLGFLRPLNLQLVARDDSALGSYSRTPQTGLVPTYDQLIRTAFRREWWDSSLIVVVDNNSNAVNFIPRPNRPLADNEFTLMEYNFPLFFGLSVQAYQATLVSNDTPLDRYLEGNKAALTSQQQRGLEVFQNKGKCINCHGGAELTNASVRNVQNQLIERMVMGDNGVAVYDNGFYNIAVRPTNEDVGVGDTDPFGKPLSISRLTQSQGQTPNVSCEPDVPSDQCGPLRPNERVAVDGAFKTPSLRNIALTAPYFHNGGNLTLRQVVEFYNRGGDFHEQNIADLDPDIVNLNLSEQEKQDLVAFLLALTDERVRFEKAPFDHPSLILTNGHPGNTTSVTPDPASGNVNATDDTLTLPAVGRNGGSAIDGANLPNANFLGVSGQ